MWFNAKVTFCWGTPLGNAGAYVLSDPHDIDLVIESTSEAKAKAIAEEAVAKYLEPIDKPRLVNKVVITPR
jgi:hypothetical protein